MKINDFVKVAMLVGAFFCSIMVYSQDSLPATSGGDCR